MTTLALASVKHAPGVTTAAVALAAAWGAGAVVVEADPAGGDVAARVRLPFEPGLLSLAASGRHEGIPLDLQRHVQALPAGGDVVVAPTEPDRAASAISTVASRLVSASDADLMIIDCGRAFTGTPAQAALSRADLTIFVLEPTVSAVEHLRTRISSLDGSITRGVALLIGNRPYGPADVEHALAIPVVGSLSVDPRGVAALHAGAGARRSLIVRSARTVLDAVLQLTAKAEVGT